MIDSDLLHPKLYLDRCFTGRSAKISGDLHIK